MDGTVFTGSYLPCSDLHHRIIAVYNAVLPGGLKADFWHYPYGAAISPDSLSLLMIFECRWLYIHSWQFFVVECYFEIVPHFKDAAFFFFTDLPIFTSEKLSLRCSRANHVTDLLPINLISCIMFLQLFLLFVALILWGLFFLTCCWHQNQNELIFIMK